MKAAMPIFPSGIAKGKAFINRLAERKELKEKIFAHQHMVLMAPRRYGKTSLVEKVIGEINLPYCALDLLAAYSTEYVRDQISDKISRLVLELLSTPQKAKAMALKIFKTMKPEITVGGFGQKLHLTLSSNANKDITELLLKLDEAATQAKKKTVIFIDEFQQISELKDYHSIEASIRHAVERSKNIIYIFSGSNRHLLTQMFGDKGRPLYRLCHLVNIERMSVNVYQNHLQILAKEKWGSVLEPVIFNKIMDLTEQHPFYVNTLCQLLWMQDKQLTLESIEQEWEQYVRTQRSIISHDILNLTPNQRRLMMALAVQPAKEILSANFVRPLKLSTSSVQQSIDTLLKKDLIFIDNQKLYRVLDPAIRYYLSEIV